MTAPLISVIIPAYNVEKFIDRTLRNLIGEQFDSIDSCLWEIIVVNDGSKDTSIEIINKWAARYPNNLIVIDSENGGVSTARNKGIEKSKGQYIYFMDADDLLMKDALIKLLEIAKKEEPEIMRFEFSWLDPDNYNDFENSTPNAPAELCYHNCTGNVFLNSTLGMVEYPAYWNVWTALFRRDFIKSGNFRFIPGLHIGEDYIFMWETLQKAKKATIVNEQLYFYNFRQGNASNPTNPQGLIRKANGIKLLMDYQDSYYIRHVNEMPPRAAQGFLLQLRYHSEHLYECFKQQNNKIGKIYAKLRRSRIKRNYISLKQSNNKIKAAIYIFVERLTAKFIFNK